MASPQRRVSESSLLPNVVPIADQTVLSMPLPNQHSSRRPSLQSSVRSFDSRASSRRSELAAKRIHASNFMPARGKIETVNASDHDFEASLRKVAASVDFAWLMGLLRRLITAHEVRLVLSLVEHLSNSMGSIKLLSGEALLKEIVVFRDQQHSKPYLASTLGLFDAIITDLTNSKPESKSHKIPADCSHRRADMFNPSPEFTSENSRTASEFFTASLACSYHNLLPSSRNTPLVDSWISESKSHGDSNAHTPRSEDRDHIVTPFVDTASSTVPSQEDPLDRQQHVRPTIMAVTSIKAQRGSQWDGSQFEWDAVCEQKLAPVEISDNLDDLTEEQQNWLAVPSDRFVAHPNQVWRLLWDSMALLLILCEGITVPLAIGFGMYVPPELSMLVTIIFTIDIVFNFNTGYFYGDLLIVRRWWLTKKYLRGWFALDVLSIIPFDLLLQYIVQEGFQTGNSLTALRATKIGKLLKVVRILRLGKAATLTKKLGLFSAQSFELKFFRSTLKLFVVLSFLSHWCACIFGWIGNPTNVGHPSAHLEPYDIQGCEKGGPCEPSVEGSPWLRRYGLESFSKLAQYMSALQFAVAILTGGQAPVEAGRPLERLFDVFMMFMSTLLASTVVSEILLIMQRQKDATFDFDELISTFRNFMVSRQVPFRLQAKVYRFLEHDYHSKSGKSFNRAFMTKLSPWLQIELVQELNGSQIRRHPFFKSIKDKVAMRRTCLEAKPILFAADDVIVEEGHPATCMYFLVQGKMHVNKNQMADGGVFLKPPCWIGDKCIFIDMKRGHTVVAVSFTETLCIEKDNVLSLVAEYDEVRIQYERFQKKIELTGETVRCKICSDIGHTEETCPRSLSSADEAARSGGALGSRPNSGGKLRRILSSSFGSERHSDK